MIKRKKKTKKEDTNGTISCLLYLRRHSVKGVLSDDAKHNSHILVPQNQYWLSTLITTSLDIRNKLQTLTIFTMRVEKKNEH